MNIIQKKISCGRCTLHPLFSCDMLLLDPSANQHKVCSKCMVERKLFERVFPIPDLINSNPSQKLIIYPLADDENLSNMLRTEQDLEQLCTQIEDYYSKLQSEIQSAIKIQMQNDCERAQKSITEWNLSKNRLSNLLSHDKLKDLLQSQESNSEILLHEYIFKRDSQVIKEMQEIQNSFEKMRQFKGSLQIELSHMIQADILKQIQMIELLHSKKESIISLPFKKAEQQKYVIQKWDFNNISCLPSEHYGKSKQSLLIQRLKDSIVITNKELNFDWSQCYLEKVLEQNKKYVISLELNNLSLAPQFFVGLIQTENKDTNRVDFDKISYWEPAAAHGTIQKVIKGSHLHSNYKSKIGKKIIEFRIHLKDKIVKASCPPNYENVVEITDKNVIDLSKEYVFAISLMNHDDSVEILSVVEVPSFSNEM